tara:strand:- start:1021 stop:1662 length:642 start_codon:yes stop_codon:yes gene_type:complete
MGQTLKNLCENKSDVIVEDFKAEGINLRDASAVIDFSSPEGFIFLLELCVDHNLPLISGTTGLTKEHLKLIDGAKKSIPILVAPNMSLGIANLKNSIEQYLLSNRTSLKCKIVEIHHANKKDSPSGTALEILRLLENFNNSGIESPIDIQSYRIGNNFGIHRVEFKNKDGITSFQHIANSKDIFAIVALDAARWLSSKKAGKYRFTDFLNKKL